MAISRINDHSLDSAVGNLFSVIIPTYNRAALISETLDSVKAQNYRPIQIIIVDDGSTDNTVSIVRDWDQQMSEETLRIQYVSQSNAGVAVARNTGIEMLRGEFVQFLDSDDRLHPQRLSTLAKVFQETGADFIHTGFDGFNAETGEVIQQHFGRPGENQVELALMGLLWANTLRSAFKRSLIEKIGPWDTAMTCFEDRDYVERAVANAENPVAIREILASARRGGSTRISDLFHTYEGRRFRILCEERLAEGVRNRSDISYVSKQLFASRLYALGFRSNASGWPDHGKRCGKIAECMGVDLDAKGRVRRLVWKSGRIGGKIYGLLSRVKLALGVK